MAQFLRASFNLPEKSLGHVHLIVITSPQVNHYVLITTVRVNFPEPYEEGEPTGRKT